MGIFRRFRFSNKKFNKYKRLQPDSVIEYLFNEDFDINITCECSEYSPSEDYFLCKNCNSDSL